MKEMTSRILKEFGNNLEAKLSAAASADAVPTGDAEAPAAASGGSASASPSNEISGFGLFFGSLWSAFTKWLRARFGGGAS